MSDGLGRPQSSARNGLTHRTTRKWGLNASHGHHCCGAASACRPWWKRTNASAQVTLPYQSRVRMRSVLLAPMAVQAYQVASRLMTASDAHACAMTMCLSQHAMISKTSKSETTWVARCLHRSQRLSQPGNCQPKTPVSDEPVFREHSNWRSRRDEEKPFHRSADYREN